MHNLKVTSKNNMNINSKKGVSGVLTTIILVAMAIVLVGMVSYVIMPMVREKIGHATACSPDIIGKINLNRLNTCYEDDENPDTHNSQIRINIETEDIDYDKIIVFVSKAGIIKNFEIMESEQGKNSGQTYSKLLIDDLEFSDDSIPSTIKLVPVINKEQCDVADYINEVATCP